MDELKARLRLISKLGEPIIQEIVDAFLEYIEIKENQDKQMGFTKDEKSTD